MYVSAISCDWKKKVVQMQEVILRVINLLLEFVFQ